MLFRGASRQDLYLGCILHVSTPCYGALPRPVVLPVGIARSVPL
jgi:hypothetical protein